MEVWVMWLMFRTAARARLPYKTFLWRTNLRRPKFWRSENMAKLNKNRHISDVTDNKGIFHHFVF